MVAEFVDHERVVWVGVWRDGGREGGSEGGRANKIKRINLKRMLVMMRGNHMVVGVFSFFGVEWLALLGLLV